MEIIIISEKHAIGSHLLRGVISAENAKLGWHFPMRNGLRHPSCLRVHAACPTQGRGGFVFSLPLFQEVHFPRRYTAVLFPRPRENLGRKVETTFSSRPWGYTAHSQLVFFCRLERWQWWHRPRGSHSLCVRPRLLNPFLGYSSSQPACPVDVTSPFYRWGKWSAERENNLRESQT